MQIYSCLIVDDDDEFVANFLNQIEKLSFLKIVERCKTYCEALMALKEHVVDLILLDINLNSEDRLDGFDLLRQHPNLPPVILISSSPDYAVESYTIGIAKDFLTKPIDTRRLLLAINRALDINIESGLILDKNAIFFKMGRKFQRFDISEIDYFEGYGIYAKVIANGISYVINDSLTNLENTLDSKKFMRVHKSYIVHLNKLTGFDHNKLYLKNCSVPIGTSYKTKLESLLKLFGNDLEITT